MTINKFSGEYAFLSNFYPCKFEFENFPYFNSEQAFQASKTTNTNDKRKIREAKDPGEAKRLGRKIKLRPDWESVKLKIMEEILTEKFKNPELKRRLLNTGNEELIEGNTWGDTFWGIYNNRGQNWLGKLLMQVREKLR